jgi:hypothetical protein
LNWPIGGVEEVGEEQLTDMGLGVGGIIFEEASDLATREKLNPIGRLYEPVMYGYEEVGGLPNILDEAGRRYWGRCGSI